MAIHTCIHTHVNNHFNHREKWMTHSVNMRRFVAKIMIFLRVCHPRRPSFQSLYPCFTMFDPIHLQ